MHKSGSGMNSNSVPLGGGAEAKWSSSNRAHLVSLDNTHTSQKNMYNLFFLLLCDSTGVTSCFPSKTVYPVCSVTKRWNRFPECVRDFLSGSQKAVVWQLEWTPWQLTFYSFNPVKAQRNVVQPTYECRLQWLLQGFRPPAGLNERCVSKK